MENKIIFYEVNKKIDKLKQKFLLRVDWEDVDVDFTNIHNKTWQNADHLVKGGKIKAIDELTLNMPSNSAIFYAPKGGIMNLHSHPQLEFCICLSGKIKFTINKDEVFILEPIKSVYIKPNDLHSVEFIEESQVIVSWFPKIEY